MNKQADLLFRLIKRLKPNNPKGYVKFHVYDEHIDYMSDMDIISGDEGSHIQVPSPLDQFIEKLIDDNLDKIDEKKQSDDTGYVIITLAILPDERKFVINAEAQYYDTEGSGTTYDDLKNEKPEWYKIINEYFDTIGNPENILATYEGGGDSGYLNSNAETDKQTNVEITDDIEDIIYRILNNDLSGWEINEGSQGQVFITRNSIEIEHIWNVERERDMDLDIEIKV